MLMPRLALPRLAHFLFFLALTAGSVAGPVTPGAIEHKDLDRFWVLDSTKPRGKIPTLRDLHARYPDGIWLDYSLTIDSAGTPVDFEAHSIEPTDAPVERFRLRVLFHRYKPGPDNPHGTPVRFRARQRFWVPKGDVSFPG